MPQFPSISKQPPMCPFPLPTIHTIGYSQVPNNKLPLPNVTFISQVLRLRSHRQRERPLSPLLLILGRSNLTQCRALSLSLSLLFDSNALISCLLYLPCLCKEYVAVGVWKI